MKLSLVSKFCKFMIFFCGCTILLCGNVLASTLKLSQGRWLFVTVAQDGPSTNDFDFLASVAASAALTDGQPAVLAVTNVNSLAADDWHEDYIKRYNSANAIVVGQSITSVQGVFQLITLNSVSAGVEQAKAIASTVWQSSDKAVVCSSSDYSSALIAASLAARLRAPLLFSASSGDLNTTIGDLGVTSALVVGSSVSLPVSSTVLPGAADVINWLRANGFPVNYLAAVNPADRAAGVEGRKISLASTIIAARRGGVVVPLQNASTFTAAKSDLSQVYSAVSVNYCPEFLLVGAAHAFIPLAELNGLSADPAWTNLMTDATYANVDADSFLEIAVGRLTANNFSEGSLIASRISTYDSLKDGNWEHRFAEMGRWGMFDVRPVLQNCGFTMDDLMGSNHNNSPPIEDGIILHYDHSGWTDLGYAFNCNNLTTVLAPAFILSKGCGTAALDKGADQITENLLRQGAVAYMGGPRNLQGMATHMATEVFNAITQMEPLGHAYRRAFEAVSLNVLDNDDHGSNISRYNFILIGDPAMVIHVPSRPAANPSNMAISTNGRTLTITAPETWWVRPFPGPLLSEWSYSNTLHGVIGAGGSLMGYWAGSYDLQIPYFIAKYSTTGQVQNISQQAGITSPLGWRTSYASSVHMNSHPDGTKTYLWRVRMMDFGQENGGTNRRAITSVTYTISNTVSVVQNLAPVWRGSPIIKMNAENAIPYAAWLGDDASDPDGDPLSFVKTGGAPWLEVALNGALSGTPDAEGVSTANVTVTDGVNPAVPVTVQITVVATPPHDTTPPSPSPMTWVYVPTQGSKGSILGSYQRLPVQNGWHAGKIILRADNSLIWSNVAGAVWSVIPDYTNQVLVNVNGPYGNHPMSVVSGQVAGIRINNELYNHLEESGQRISMTAAPASDMSGVEYYFDETSENPGGTDSGWQVSPIYVDEGLMTGCTYAYTVRARDKSMWQNTGATSIVKQATLSRYNLAVSSAYGAAIPTGLTTPESNTLVNARMTGSPMINGTTQYMCTGWVSTGSLASGSGTNASFTITNATTITWLWMTNYWVKLAVEGMGRATGTLSSVSDWFKAGTNITVTAAPADIYSQFDCWTGGTNGAAISTNVLSVSNLSNARAITAVFKERTTASNAVPYAWLNGVNTNWTTVNQFETSITNDPDGDGFTTAQEYWCGTDPMVNASFLHVSGIDSSGGSIRLIWEHAGVHSNLQPIAVEWRSNLVYGGWLIATNVTPVNGTNMWNGAGSGQRYYRLCVPAMP